MRGTTKVLVTTALTLLLSSMLVGAAGAYPRAVSGWWTCPFLSPSMEIVFEEHRDRYYDMNKMSRDGRYSYNRDTGKVKFRTGYMDGHYGKMKKHPTGWTLVIRKAGVSIPISVCSKSGG